MLLMIVAVINAAPMADMQRTDEGSGPPTMSTSSGASDDGAPAGDVDVVAGPGPTGTGPGNDPQGTTALACVPTDPSNVCQLGVESGSANRSKIVC